ncbi:AAA family ATPase [Candidatus Uhrbacteria bacterium]|nr:AAA family ATPase [Candidatus Uhrbacteria bacterium]
MENLLEKLNEPQKKAVTHENGPLLIVAGAGTGKTTVLTRRYAWLLREKGLSTENIAAVTFTEKAAQEMEDRVLEMLPVGTYDFWIHTFHGLCQRVLEDHALEIGLPNTFRLVSETDAWLMLKRRFDELPLDHYRPLGNQVKFLQALLRHISRAKDEGITPDRYVEFAENCKLDGDTEIVLGERKRLKELADVYVAYQKILRDEGVMDFGDLIMETLRLFKERPSVLQSYRNQFKYLLVDEFQDTNWAQYELIKMLAEPENNITVVGDDDQAIYKFRGASLANILQFKDDFKDTATVALIDNYRSHQEVLDTAYNLIAKNNPNRLEVSLADQGLNKQLKAFLGEGAQVRVHWDATIQQEAEWVAEDIAARHSEKLSWSDIAILVRSNDDALPFVRALEHKGIPFKFFALRGLYTKPVVLDVMAILSILVRPYDNTVCWRLLNLPSLSIDNKAIARLLAYADEKGVPMSEALGQTKVFLQNQPKQAEKLDNLDMMLEKLKETAKRETPLAVLHAVLDETGYLAYLLKRSEKEKVEAVNLLNEFVARIRRYEYSTNAPSLKDFIDELRLEIESGEQGALHQDAESGPDMVRVMTVHASKGLEFDTVYLVSLVDQRFPTRRRSDAIPLPDGLVQERLQDGDAHLEEERRLFYVAMTRAKQRLMLSGAKSYGGVRDKKPSAFLTEAGLDVPEAPYREAVDTSELEAPGVQEVKDDVWREQFALKRRFSFTQLVAYKKCPMQYKFAHVYRIPVLGSYQKSFGQSVHLALQVILSRHMERSNVKQESLFEASPAGPDTQSGFKTGLDEALQIYEESWIDAWYMDRKLHDEYYAEGKLAIKKFIEKCQEDPPKVKALEQGFDWNLGEHSIKGKIDRIDELDDGIAIVDYKTGEWKEGKKAELIDKEQLWLYQLASEARGVKVNKLSYDYVRSGVIEEVVLLEGEDKVKFQETLIDRMNEIMKSSFPATPSMFLCKFCDFKHICEYRK